MTMKQLPLLFIFIISLTNCQDYQREKQQKAIDERIASELESGVKKNDIFLGLTFGMPEEQVLYKLRMLVSEGKLIYNTSNDYYYEFDFGENSLPPKAQAVFSAEFYEDKLYKLSISVKSNNLVSIPELILHELWEVYVAKYGYTFLTQKSFIDEDYDDYIWIDGNRMIKLILGIDDVRIFYTDLTIKNLKELSLENETSIKIESIKNDI